MVTEYLALARHLNGGQVELADIKVGLVVHFPSSTAGVLKYECTHSEAGQHTFVSIVKGCPGKVVIKENVADFTHDDFKALSSALCAYSKHNAMVTAEQRALVQRAHRLGYARILSHTQASWTDQGINRWNGLMPPPSDAERRREALEVKAQKTLPREVFYSVIDKIGRMSEQQIESLIQEHRSAH